MTLYDKMVDRFRSILAMVLFTMFVIVIIGIFCLVLILFVNLVKLLTGTW